MWAVLWLRRPGVLAPLATVVLIGSPGAALKQSTSETLAIIHVNVIDGTGGPIRRDQTVVSSSGRITAIGDASRTPVPPGLRTIDGTGKYLIPGLWDLHVHTRYEGIDHLLLFIANGVTAIRDMGGPWEHLDVIRRWRGEIATGNRVGPRIVAAGALLDGPGRNWTSRPSSKDQTKVAQSCVG